MRIGELARLSGKSVAALRYYEQAGLLPRPQRTEGGYRDYPHEAVERVRFVNRAKGLGFSLREIAAVLDLADKGQTPCGKVARATHKKVAQIDRRIALLQERRYALTESVRLWQSGLLKDAPICPMLNVSELTRGGH